MLQDNLKDKQVVVDMTERKCQCLEEENFRLREENDRLRDELRFLRTEVRGPVHLLSVEFSPAQLHLADTAAPGGRQHMAYVSAHVCVMEQCQGMQSCGSSQQGVHDLNPRVTPASASAAHCLFHERVTIHTAS